MCSSDLQMRADVGAQTDDRTGVEGDPRFDEHHVQAVDGRLPNCIVCGHHHIIAPRPTVRCGDVRGGLDMTNELEGRIAIVTGAGDGIGAAVARAFATRGAAGVLIADRDEQAGTSQCEAVRAGGTDAVFVRTDVGVHDDVDAMVAAALRRWGRVDVLVNNAWGGGTLGRVEHKTTAAVERAFAVGFEGPLWAMQAAFPSMRAQGWGRVVNLCSLNGVNAHIEIGRAHV